MFLGFLPTAHACNIGSIWKGLQDGYCFLRCRDLQNKRRGVKEFETNPQSPEQENARLSTTSSGNELFKLSERVFMWQIIHWQVAQKNSARDQARLNQKVSFNECLHRACTHLSFYTLTSFTEIILFQQVFVHTQVLYL